jgi:hypothetical protein
LVDAEAELDAPLRRHVRIALGHCALELDGATQRVDVEEIITAISRSPWLFVIVRNSSFASEGKSPDLRQVGRELGVRYVLVGSVRKGGDKVRIAGDGLSELRGRHESRHFVKGGAFF